MVGTKDINSNDSFHVTGIRPALKTLYLYIPLQWQDLELFGILPRKNQPIGWTREMKALTAWFAVLHPDLVHDSSEMKPLLDRPELAYLKNEPRAAQLEIGKLVLGNARNATCT